MGIKKKERRGSYNVTELWKLRRSGVLLNLRSKKSLRKLWSPWEDMKEGNVALFIELDEPPKSFGKIDSFNKIILLLENAS